MTTITFSTTLHDSIGGDEAIDGLTDPRESLKRSLQLVRLLAMDQNERSSLPDWPILARTRIRRPVLDPQS